MCGIVGFIGREYVGNYEWYNEIQSMVNCINHRGPDDSGIVGVNFETLQVDDIKKNCCREYNGMLGFCRLSIRDLSINGHQPMVSEDKKVVISFNGEIYNADQYREILTLKGYRFKGHSDTEVVLNMYLEYGIEEMAQKLNGMFGIAICDLRKKRLWLLRDRVGIKPLYYAITDNRIIYASEVKAFLAIKDFKRRVNEKNLTEIISFSRPTMDILLDGVYQVAPGHIVTFDFKTFNKMDLQFFDINKYERPMEASSDIHEMADKAKEILFKCTEKQKISDVKVGCQLSGGIDSSLITYAAATRGENRLIDTLSIVFDEQKEIFSEEEYMNTVINLLEGVRPHNESMTCDYFLKNYEKVIWHADTAIGRSDVIGLFKISETAKQYVKVLLIGEGADELFGGYDMFKKGYHIADLLKRANTSEGIVTEVTPRQEELIHNFAEYAVMAQQKAPEVLCKRIMPDFDSSELMQEKIALFDSFSGSDFDKQIKYALSTYLQELLVGQDKMAMANSIENRVPFLDNEFIDFAFTIPESMLIKEREGTLQGKYIMKHLAADIFGNDFAYRRKMGFPFPFFNYMKTEAFREYFYDLVLPGVKNRGIFDVNAVQKMYEELHWSNPFTVREMFWKVCGFETWCQMYLDGRGYMEIG